MSNPPPPPTPSTPRALPVYGHTSDYDHTWHDCTPPPPTPPHPTSPYPTPSYLLNSRVEINKVAPDALLSGVEVQPLQQRRLPAAGHAHHDAHNRLLFLAASLSLPRALGRRFFGRSGGGGGGGGGAIVPPRRRACEFCRGRGVGKNAEKCSL